MCIVSLALNKHPHFPFILLNNREEDTKRETSHLEIVKDPVGEGNFLLLARDRHYGKSHLGSWTGLHLSRGHFAVVTNVFEPEDLLHHQNTMDMMKNRTNRNGASSVVANGSSSSSSTSTSHERDAITRPKNKQHYLSRGTLIHRCLIGEARTALKEEGTQYGAFNLLYGNLFHPQMDLREGNSSGNGNHSASHSSETFHFTVTTNRKPHSPCIIQDPFSERQHVDSGVHALSNSHFDDDAWPKVNHLRFTIMEKVKHLKHVTDPDELLRRLVGVMCLTEVVDCPSKISVPKHLLSEKMNQSTIRKLKRMMCCVWQQDQDFSTVSQTVLLADEENVYYYYHIVDQNIDNSATTADGDSIQQNNDDEDEDANSDTNEDFSIPEFEDSIKRFHLEDRVSVKRLLIKGDAWVRVTCKRK